MLLPLPSALAMSVAWVWYARVERVTATYALICNLVQAYTVCCKSEPSGMEADWDSPCAHVYNVGLW